MVRCEEQGKSRAEAYLTYVRFWIFAVTKQIAVLGRLASLCLWTALWQAGRDGNRAGLPCRECFLRVCQPRRGNLPSDRSFCRVPLHPDPSPSRTLPEFSRPFCRVPLNPDLSLSRTLPVFSRFVCRVLWSSVQLPLSPFRTSRCFCRAVWNLAGNLFLSGRPIVLPSCRALRNPAWRLFSCLGPGRAAWMGFSWPPVP